MDAAVALVGAVEEREEDLAEEEGVEEGVV